MDTRPVTTRDRSPAELDANRPSQPITAPNKSRHVLDAISRRSQSKVTYSLALPDVDLVRETDLIRRGYGDSLGNNRWRVDGRTYVREGNLKGMLFPESGPGIVVLNRGEYAALVILVKYNGYSAKAANELRHNPFTTDEAVAVARDLFAKRTKKS